MCIRYNVEFWLPYKDTDADWERKVRRGLASPGTNPDGRTVFFFECNGRFYKTAKCAASTIEDGGTYGGRIFDFCYEDDDCFLRLKELESQNTADMKMAKQAERERWATDLQEEATRYWKRAYDGWTSAYDNHRDCPWRRYQSTLYNWLKRADIVRDEASISDDLRMGSHPGRAEDPITGITRHYDAPQRRY